MSKVVSLSNELKNSVVTIKSIDECDCRLINHFLNIGIYPGNKVFVCDYVSKKIINIVVDNVQYALRIEDANKIKVSY